MSHKPDDTDEQAEPTTLEEALETIRVLRRELGSTRKESARRRQALRERDGQEADAGVWRTIAVEAVVQAEALAAGARRPELLGRLVEVNAIEGETLDEIREVVRERVGTTLEDAPELKAEPVVTSGALSPGPRGERPRRKADPDAWLRKAARGG